MFIKHFLKIGRATIATNLPAPHPSSPCKSRRPARTSEELATGCEQLTEDVLLATESHLTQEQGSQEARFRRLGSAPLALTKKQPALGLTWIGQKLFHFTACRLPKRGNPLPSLLSAPTPPHPKSHTPHPGTQEREEWLYLQATS